jgi:hypothetical protein
LDLELTGRAIPPDAGRWKLATPNIKPKSVIERRGGSNQLPVHIGTKLKNFCYHHHVDDPTKVVELDPLPNNSLANKDSLPRWQPLSEDESKMKPAGLVGKVPILPAFNGQNSVSLEEKLNEITSK